MGTLSAGRREMTVLLEIGLWLLRKFGVALVVVAVALLAGGLYLYLSDELHSESERGLTLQELQVRAAQLQESVIALEGKLQNLRADLEKQRQRAEIARRLLVSYEEMRSFWQWLFGPPLDRNELAAKEARAREQRSEAAQKTESLAAEVTALAAEHHLALDDLTRTTTEITRLEKATSPVLNYARRAWRQFRWPVAIMLVGYFFGPTAWKAFAFFAIAPLVQLARPIRLAAGELPSIVAPPSHVSETVVLRPCEAVHLKERFLQASDESLRRRTRFVLDWQIPFTCAACGLIELVELRNPTDAEAVVTASTQDDPTIELSVIDVPAGSALVLRPSFLAGVAVPSDRRLKIRRHWRLLHLQAWLTLQFRFFEFIGPCRLIVSGSRGVRAEPLEPAAPGRARSRRTNQDSTIGFTPDLEYRSARAETFWSYYRGRNPLFDDLFVGRGTFLCQEIASDTGPAAQARRFWSTFWDAVLRVFGL